MDTKKQKQPEFPKIKILPAIFVLFLLFYVFTRSPSEDKLKDTQFILGTVCEIELNAPATEENEAILIESFELIREYDRLLSNYKEASDISRLNREAHLEATEVDPRTYFVLQSSEKYFQLSEGLFDITVFPLVKAWGFFNHDMRIPSRAAINDAKERVGMEHVRLLSGNKVFFEKSGLSVDVGGIGKGYICDQIASFLKDKGIESFIVNIGGNIFASGVNPHHKPWKIGIRNPRDPEDLIETIELDDLAISTSGDYERFFMHEGKRYSHILNPETGWPQEGVVAVTVVDESAMVADAASTILFLTPEEKRQRIFHLLEVDKMFLVIEKEGELETIIYESQD